MIDAIGAVTLAAVRAEPSVGSASTAAASPGGFSRMLAHGMENLQARMERADTVVLEATHGNLESPHVLMVELEQARISLQLAVEVRNRLIEGYQELLRMQV